MTDNTENRIRLAKAMGWTHIRMKYVAMDEQSYPFGCVPGNVNDTHLKEQIPDPYTDANDDYAVLEWMRKNCRESAGPEWYADSTLKWENELAKIWEGRSNSYCPYQIGDYARAALKVLDND